MILMKQNLLNQKEKNTGIASLAKRMCVSECVHIYIYIRVLQGKNDSCFTRMLASFGCFTSGPIDLGSSS